MTTSTTPAATALLAFDAQAMTLDGVAVATLPALLDLLADRRIAAVLLQPAPDTGYERIGQVIYGLTRAGIAIEAIKLPPSETSGQTTP